MSLEHKKNNNSSLTENSRGSAPNVSIFVFKFQHANLSVLFVQKVDAFTIGDLAKAIQ